MIRGEIRASAGRPTNGTARLRGSCVRVGELPISAGGAGISRAFWLTLPEAEQLLTDLMAAVATARKLSPLSTPPRGPDAAAAAAQEAA